MEKGVGGRERGEGVKGVRFEDKKGGRKGEEVKVGEVRGVGIGRVSGSGRFCG